MIIYFSFLFTFYSYNNIRFFYRFLILCAIKSIFLISSFLFCTFSIFLFWFSSYSLLNNLVDNIVSCYLKASHHLSHNLSYLFLILSNNYLLGILFNKLFECLYWIRCLYFFWIFLKILVISDFDLLGLYLFLLKILLNFDWFIYSLKNILWLMFRFSIRIFRHVLQKNHIILLFFLTFIKKLI